MLVRGIGERADREHEPVVRELIAGLQMNGPLIAVDAGDRIVAEDGVEFGRQRGYRIALRHSEPEGLEYLEGMHGEVVLRRDERERHAVPDQTPQRDRRLEAAHSRPRHNDAQRLLVRMRVACHRRQGAHRRRIRHPGDVAGRVGGNYGRHPRRRWAADRMSER